MESSQSIQLTPLVKSNRHGEHKNPYYHREYYLKNREKLLAYGHEYYGVKKLLKKCSRSEKKETKIGVKKISSLVQAHNNTYNNLFLINSRYYGGVGWEHWIRETSEFWREGKFLSVETDLIFMKSWK